MEKEYQDYLEVVDLKDGKQMHLEKFFLSAEMHFPVLKLNLDINS
jgi:hypothetical protein